MGFGGADALLFLSTFPLISVVCPSFVSRSNCIKKTRAKLEPYFGFSELQKEASWQLSTKWQQAFTSVKAGTGSVLIPTEGSAPSREVNTGTVNSSLSCGHEEWSSRLSTWRNWESCPYEGLNAVLNILPEMEGSPTGRNLENIS